MLMDIASCSLPFFTISYRRRAEEKRLAIDVPELPDDHTDCTCGFLFSPPRDSLMVFSIEIDQRAIVNARWAATLISGRVGLFFVFFSSSLNLSRREAVNSPHQQGGKQGGTGSPQQAMEFKTMSCLVKSFKRVRGNA